MERDYMEKMFGTAAQTPERMEKAEAHEKETIRPFSETGEYTGLTNAEKAWIKGETGWSDEIIDIIGSMAEYEIYEKAGLVEAEIGTKKCLIREDIDFNRTDGDGITNRDRMERGLKPFINDDEAIELHLIGQRVDDPLAELTTDEHRGKGNYAIHKNRTRRSEVGRNFSALEREEYWKSRISVS